MVDEAVSITGCTVCGADPTWFAPDGSPLCPNCRYERFPYLAVLLLTAALTVMTVGQVLNFLFLAGMLRFAFNSFQDDTPVPANRSGTR